MLSVSDAEPGLSGAELARDTMLTPQSVNAIVLRLGRAGSRRWLSAPPLCGRAPGLPGVSLLDVLACLLTVLCRLRS